MDKIKKWKMDQINKKAAMGGVSEVLTKKKGFLGVFYPFLRGLVAQVECSGVPVHSNVGIAHTSPVLWALNLTATAESGAERMDVVNEVSNHFYINSLLLLVLYHLHPPSSRPRLQCETFLYSNAQGYLHFYCKTCTEWEMGAAGGAPPSACT